LITQTNADLSVKSSSGAEVPAQSHAGQQVIQSYKEFKERCAKLFQQNNWQDLLRLLDEKTTSLGESKRARNLQESAKIFRGDYESIQKQERDGLLTAQGVKQWRRGLWASIIVFIDDIHGQLKF
jgi:adenine-specific DNA glycosylase